ncbi:uncharacterized protein LOC112501638 isoform X2 [Cynara cardunculus var. scolymus]|uniref:uncharacterized protein LOC112501638 isoform X2 n=1 Tax=Cynara cardunculus var. scolymus TaxID=59895 RepID=UPI000D6253BD|nr:uncharacterized protein LOC112501638 isoform X2 [Cynara cardunculus var. scolymus]
MVETPEVRLSSKISKNSSKRFLFDKRYGYVYDDWREPSEVALAYGRGMFCIVPLGKALFKMVSESQAEPLKFLRNQVSFHLDHCRPISTTSFVKR